MTSVATLLFDSLTSKRLGGLRGYTSSMRQMLFTTGAVDIDIQIVASAGNVSITGQALARNHRPAVGSAVLLQARAALLSIPLSKFGEFHFDQLAPGAYSLQICTPDDAIDVPEFDLVA